MSTSKEAAVIHVRDSRIKVLATSFREGYTFLHLIRISQVTSPLVHHSSSLCHCAHEMLAALDSLSKPISSWQRAPKAFDNYLLKSQAPSRCHLLWQVLPHSRKATLLPLSFDDLFILQWSSQIQQPVSLQVGGRGPCSGNG